MADDAKLIAIVEANTKQFENALKRLEGVTKASTDRMTASVKKMDSTFAGLGGRISSVAKGFATWSAASMIIGRVTDAIKKFDDIADKAAATGLSTDFFQALGVAAEKAGAGQDKMNAALVNFAKVAGQAQTGTGRFAATLKQLNPELLKNIQNAKSQEERVKLLADALKNTTDASQRAAIAAAALGSNWAELIEVFVGGRKSLDDLVASAKEMGLIVPRELLERAGELQEKMGTLATVIDTQLNEALISLGPTLVDIAGFVADVAKEVTNLLNIFNGLVDQVAQKAPQTAKFMEYLRHVMFDWDMGKAYIESEAKRVAAEAAGGAPRKPLKVTVHPPPVNASTPGYVPPGGGSGRGGGGSGRGGRPTGPSMTTVRTKGGLEATVDARFADQFQGALDDLEALMESRGRSITRLSGLRPGATVAGTGRPSQHRYGKAIDINPQINVGTFEGGAISDAEMRAITARWGLRWGGDFRKRDTMHVDVMGKQPMGEEALNTAKGLSNEAEKLAENTEKAADAAKSYDDAAKSVQNAITNANQAFKRDLLGGFIRDLERGVKPAEALANALQKISDRLLDMALNAIFPDVGGAILGAAMAGGGVMTNRGPVPLKRYAGGGVAHSPQMAMFGEGSGAEAFVPLPDGRRIPVNMRVPGMGVLGGGHGRQGMDIRLTTKAEPSPLLITHTAVVARQAGRDAVVEVSDGARRRPGGR